MAGPSMLITLSLVSVSCAIAVILSRRWQLRLAPSWLASVGWAFSCLAAYRFILNGWPPIPWSPAALEAEPWESVVYPLMSLGLVWPILFERLKTWPRVSSVAALLVCSFPILAALCQTERYAHMFLGNTVWAFAALFAVCINWLSMERLQSSGAGRWSLWIIVGQGLTAGAILMTCYGRFGEWATATAIALGVVAIARIFVHDPEASWSTHLALPALTLHAVLIMHIREYRSHPLPTWLIPLPFLLPSLVAGVDGAWSGRLHPALRVVIAGVLTAGLAIGIIAIVLAINGPSEW